jgi:hypothetical protein
MNKKNNKEVDVQGLASNKRKRKLRCCFCGVEITEFIGNNPWPFRNTGRCCRYCDDHYVIPLRLRLGELERERQLAERQSVKSQS